MIIQSQRIGTVEVQEEKLISIPEGLLGFPQLKTFFLADDPADVEMPLKWLVPIENPEILFLVTDPGIFFKDYVFDLPSEDQKALKVTSEDEVSVIVVLTVPADPKQITANLRGPLVINWKTRVGRQVILKDSPYEVKHYIFTPETREKVTTSVPAPAEILAPQAGLGVDTPLARAE